MSFPPVPPEVKSVAHFLKVASEHEDRNVVVTYWARMWACQRAMAIVPGKKSPEVTKLLVALMEWMEKIKKEQHDNDGITSETTAHALIEEYALQLFAYGDTQDRASNFDKNTIKAFYTAGILMDILEQFGALSEDIHSKRKYAKWKAAYIHNCLKTGDIPIPGAPDEHLNNVVHKSDLVDDDSDTASAGGSNITPPSSSTGMPPSFPSLPKQPSTSSGDPSPTLPRPPPITPQDPAPGFTAQPSAGFVAHPAKPYVPPPSTSGGVTLTPVEMQKAQKYCKYASSALNYDDVQTAIENLTKALNVLQTGKEE